MSKKSCYFTEQNENKIRFKNNSNNNNNPACQKSNTPLPIELNISVRPLLCSVVWVVNIRKFTSFVCFLLLRVKGKSDFFS